MNQQRILIGYVMHLGLGRGHKGIRGMREPRMHPTGIHSEQLAIFLEERMK